MPSWLYVAALDGESETATLSASVAYTLLSPIVFQKSYTEEHPDNDTYWFGASYGLILGCWVLCSNFPLRVKMFTLGLRP